MTAVTDAFHKILDTLEFRLQNGDMFACKNLSILIGDIMMKVQNYLPKKGRKHFRATTYY